MKNRKGCKRTRAEEGRYNRKIFFKQLLNPSFYCYIIYFNKMKPILISQLMVNVKIFLETLFYI